MIRVAKGILGTFSFKHPEAKRSQGRDLRRVTSSFYARIVSTRRVTGHA